MPMTSKMPHSLKRRNLKVSMQVIYAFKLELFDQLLDKPETVS